MIEYSQTSGDKLKDVKKFAILVVNTEYGSKIMECDPPKDVIGNNQAASPNNTTNPIVGGANNMQSMKM